MRPEIGQAAVAMLVIVAALVSVGCDRSCAFYFRCGETGGAGGAGGTGGEGGGDVVDRCPEDPADGPIAAECGIWVAASWGKDGNAGTQDAPVATLAQAIMLAKAGPGRVDACNETFTEAVELPSGISLGGGFSCDAGHWTYDGKDKPAIIAPAPPVLAALTVLPGDELSMVTDLQVESPDAVEPSASSIAVMYRKGANATIKRSHLIAGNGADGKDGEDGDHNGAPAQSGLPGNGGADACSANPGLGGLPVKLECDDVATVGGNGGNGGDQLANDGTSGLPQPDPNPQGFGAEGEGESGVNGLTCTGGVQGKAGNSGIDGAGATDFGTISEQGYAGAAGEDGFPGAPGQGGGGGGGSIGGAICGGMPHSGAGGGSGGTGGCGGKPGKGGHAGGSSIALMVLGRGLTLRDLQVTLGKGGNGGNGGVLQLGGQGGFPGLGGLGLGGAGGIKPACHGGAGGQGGNGGNGGGGRGGHALAVALVPGADPDQSAGLMISFGVGGDGGKGGNPDLQGSGGKEGLSADARTFGP